MWEEVIDTVTRSEAVYFSHAPEGVHPAVRWKHLTIVICLDAVLAMVGIYVVLFCVRQEPRAQTNAKMFQMP